MGDTQRDAFLFYRSYYDAVKELNKRDRAAAMLAICEYGLYGTVPELTGAAAAVWILIKPILDANVRRYENGRRGGRPKKEPAEGKPNDNQSETETEPNGNQTETEAEPNRNQTVTKPKGNKGQETRDKGQGIKDKRQETRDKGQDSAPGGGPSLSEVEEFCLSSGGTSAAAAAFYAQYSSAGWKSNGRPVENWRGLLTNFLRNGGGQGVKEGGVTAPSAAGERPVPASYAKALQQIREEDDDGEDA